MDLSLQSSACCALPWPKKVKFGSGTQGDRVSEAPVLRLCLASPLSILALSKGWQPCRVPGSSWMERFVFWYQALHTVTSLTVSAPSSELWC